MLEQKNESSVTEIPVDTVDSKDEVNPEPVAIAIDDIPIPSDNSKTGMTPVILDDIVLPNSTTPASTDKKPIIQNSSNVPPLPTPPQTVS